jgi:hypothetical protein
LPKEIGQGADQLELAKGDATGQAQGAFGGVVNGGDIGLGLIERLGHGAAFFVECAAFLGERNARTGAAQQAQADVILKVGDLFAESGGGLARRAGSGRDGAHLNHFHKDQHLRRHIHGRWVTFPKWHNPYASGGAIARALFALSLRCSTNSALQQQQKRAF